MSASVFFSVMQIRCWEVQPSGTVIPKAQQTHAGPVLDVSWSDVSSFDATSSRRLMVVGS